TAAAHPPPPGGLARLRGRAGAVQVLAGGHPRHRSAGGEFGERRGSASARVAGKAARSGARVRGGARAFRARLPQSAGGARTDGGDRLGGGGGRRSTHPDGTQVEGSGVSGRGGAAARLEVQRKGSTRESDPHRSSLRGYAPVRSRSVRAGRRVGAADAGARAGS